jgi:hypothetical protein
MRKRERERERERERGEKKKDNKKKIYFLLGGFYKVNIFFRLLLKNKDGLLFANKQCDLKFYFLFIN